MASNCACWAISSCEGGADALLAFQPEQDGAGGGNVFVVQLQALVQQAQPKIATGDVGFSSNRVLAAAYSLASALACAGAAAGSQPHRSTS